VKLQQLKKTMQDLQVKHPGEKILIFTESRDTLDYLEKRIRSWGYSINVIQVECVLKIELQLNGFSRMKLKSWLQPRLLVKELTSSFAT
jgi:hypothetical protein